METIFDSTWVAHTLELPPPQKTQFTAISTDSRKLKGGELFVALSGEHFNGSDFIAEAVSKGAKGILSQQQLVRYPGIVTFEHPNPQQALRLLAASWRSQFKIPVLQVSGSAGKTTTKQLLASILQGKWKSVLSTYGSQNGFLGIPLTLLELRAHHQMAVIEVGIDEPGAMQQHCDLVQASHGLLTCIGEEHLEKLVDLATVFYEESIALKTIAQQGGAIFLNMGDPWIASLATQFPSQSVFLYQYGKPLNAHRPCFYGTLDGEELLFRTPQGESFQLPCPLPGEHNALNLIAACTVAITLGMTPQEIQFGLQSFEGSFGRSEIHLWKDNIEIIADYYNSQPASLSQALKLLHQRAKKRQIAVLADMLELGSSEQKLHEGIAHSIQQYHPEVVYLLGSRMLFLKKVLETNFQGELTHFETHQALAEHLKNKVQPEDTILIKGSRGMKMEEVWKLLKS